MAMTLGLKLTGVSYRLLSSCIMHALTYVGIGLKQRTIIAYVLFLVYFMDINVVTF